VAIKPGVWHKRLYTSFNKDFSAAAARVPILRKVDLCYLHGWIDQ
jgi:hypothetical protein